MHSKTLRTTGSHSIFFRFSGLLMAGLLLGGLPSAATAAQGDSAERDRLAERLEEAKAELDPAGLPSLSHWQSAFLQQVESTRRSFKQITDPANAAAWRRFVDADELVDAIESEAPLAEQNRLAEAMRYRLTKNLDGLNLPAIVQLRQTVVSLIAAIRFRDHERSIQLLAQQLDALAERIRGLDPVPSTDDTAAISAVLGLLAEAGQAEGVIQDVRRAFAQPNLAIHVDESLIRRAVARPVLRTRPVNDCILGTRLIGEATLNGHVSGQLLPSPDSVRILLSFDAAFQSRNTGYNGPVSLQTVGTGDVHVSRTLVIDDNGPRLEATTALANLHTRILCINHPLRIVRKIAANQAAQQKPRSEQIAKEKLERRVAGEFASETQGNLNRPSNGPLDEAWETFARMGLSPPQRSFQTNRQSIEIAIKQAEPTQILAADAPPSLDSGHDVVVQLHETIIDNVGSTVLAGRTMNQEQIRGLLENARPGDTSPAAEESGEEEVAPFAIDFARRRPLILEARDQTVRLGIRGTRFQQGDRDLQRAMEITAQYQPVVDHQGNMHLQRDGNIGVAFPGGGRLNISQVAIKANIQRAFAEIFPDQILNRPIQIPLQGGREITLQPAAIQATDAWLSVALRQES